jgi:hypothetical protein
MDTSKLAISYSYDVVVVGGGISGAVAAIAAGRAGAKSLLLERFGFLGGMLTAAGVGPMMTFHAGATQVVQGITGELIERLQAKGHSIGHIPDTTGFTYSVTPFDPEGMKRELEIMAIDAGVDILYHTTLADGTVENGQLVDILICNKAGLERCQARVFIDATGDADLSARIGVPFEKGRKSDGLAQPMTMKLRLYNVDIPRIKNFIKDHPEEFPRLKGETHGIDLSPRLSIGGFVKTFGRAKADGAISFEREDLLFFETNNPGEVIVNTSRITGLDATDPKQLTQGEIEGRRQAEELYRFLKGYVPGFEQAIVHSTGPQIGVRSSRQVRGVYTLTRDDVASGKKFEDSVVCYGYPVDIHNPSGSGTEASHLQWGDYYTIPYRSLINSGIRNIVNVGRGISAEFEAQSAFRTTPGSGAIGHAGGCASYLALSYGDDFSKVPVGELQDMLRSQGAFLPDFS